MQACGSTHTLHITLVLSKSIFSLLSHKESITIADCCVKTSVKAWYSTDVFKETSGQLFPL